MNKASLILISLLVLTSFRLQQEVSGTVTYVSDGDTFHLETSAGDKIKVRVAEIDTPEKSQDYGLEAKAFTAGEIKGKTVTLSIQSTDRYGRSIAKVSYDQKDLATELVKAGLAWHYKQYSKNELLSQLEKEAKKNSVGLWSDLNAVAPWEFRRLGRN